MSELWRPTPHIQICAGAGLCRRARVDVQIGGSVRGYQAIFVPLAALSSPGYSPVGGQPAVYLYIAALEANCPLLPLREQGSRALAVVLARSQDRVRSLPWQSVCFRPA